MNQDNFRMTPQRRVILDCLQRERLHPTADEVFQMVRKDMPRISLGTVYRNLESLCERGLITRNLGGGQRRYESKVSTHYHVRCVDCGSLEDLLLEPFEFPDDFLRKNTNYQILGHMLEFQGVCPDCQVRRAAATPDESDSE